MADAAGRRAPRIRLPLAPLWPIAVASELAARRFGLEPRVTREMLQMARKKMYFSSDKARRELGYSPRPASEAVRDAVAWFRAAGMAPA